MTPEPAPAPTTPTAPVPCARCGLAPRAIGQRWCKSCRNLSKQIHRSARRRRIDEHRENSDRAGAAAPQTENTTENPAARLFAAIERAVVHQEGRSVDALARELGVSPPLIQAAVLELVAARRLRWM